MAMNQYLEKYRSIREGQNVSDTLFHEVVYLFPAIMVVMADEEIDWLEDNYLYQKIAEEAKSHEFYSTELADEISFIKANYETVKPILLDALAAENQQEDHSNDILDLMLSTAQVSSESLRNNLVYGRFHNYFDVFRSIVGFFVKPDPDRSFITESEKETILEVLDHINGLNDRNYQVLKNLEES